MSTVRELTSAAGVIQAAIVAGRVFPMDLAAALGDAGLLMSPEIAAELVKLRSRKATCEALEAILDAQGAEITRLRASGSAAHDDLVAALGCSAGTEWSDLIDIATTYMRTAEGIETAGAKALRSAEARIAELEAERHTTNEALADVTEALRTPEERMSPEAAFAAADAHIRGDGCAQCKPSNRLPEMCPEGQRLSRRAMASLTSAAPAVDGAPC